MFRFNEGLPPDVLEEARKPSLVHGVPRDVAQRVIALCDRYSASASRISSETGMSTHTSRFNASTSPSHIPEVRPIASGSFRCEGQACQTAVRSPGSHFLSNRRGPPHLSAPPEQLSRFAIYITAIRTSGRVKADMSVETRITPATSSGRLSYMRAKR